MNSKSIRFSREAGMEVQKRNITDTETPVLEKVALEEQLKDMKLDLEDNGNGIPIPELKLPEVLETSDHLQRAYRIKPLPHDSSMPVVITFVFLLLVSVLAFNHRRKIVAFILEGGTRRRSQRYTRLTST